MAIRRALSRLFILVLALSAFTPATAGATWTAGPCPDAGGVTVAADLTGAGGREVVVRCAPGHEGDARTAMRLAGFEVRHGEQLGAYLDEDYVCRIDGLPAADPCSGHVDGAGYWRVWRVGVDPLGWRGSGTDGGPSALRTCAGSLVGFSYGTGTSGMTKSPPDIITRPGWLPPTC